MGTVVADMTMSVDGFIADPDDGVGPLFRLVQRGLDLSSSSPAMAGMRTSQRRAPVTCDGW